MVFISFTVPSPLPAVAETTNEGILRMKIRILQLQIEVLKAQIALLAKGVQVKEISSITAAAVKGKNCAQLEIFWDSVRGATSYRLYRDGIMVYEGTARSFVDSGLFLERKYKYVVYGLYRGEQGEPSNVYEITAPNVCPPKIPTLNFEAKPCGGQITIKWTPDIQAAKYQLFRGNKEIYNGSFFQFIDSNLQISRNYEYKIRAGNKGGWSDFSTPTSFKSSGVCAPTVSEVSYVVPETSKEGILSAEMRSSPADNVKLKALSANQSIMAFNVKAQFSDITITRLDLFFNFRPWHYLDKIKIQYAGRTIAEEKLVQGSFIYTEGDIYLLRFQNIQAVVKDGGSGIFTVKIDTKNFQPLGSPHSFNIFLENNSIRGVDEEGLWQYAPATEGGKQGNFIRTFIIE